MNDLALLNWAQVWPQDFVELKTQFPMTQSVEEYRKYVTAFPLISQLFFLKAVVSFFFFFFILQTYSYKMNIILK